MSHTHAEHKQSQNVKEKEETQTVPQETPSPSDKDQSCISEIEQTLEDYKDKYVRALAEIENIRRRAAKDQEDAAKFGATMLAKDIIPFVDNLERATMCCPKFEENKEFSAFIDGIYIIINDILSSLEKHGIRKVDSTGNLFDPALHQAVAQIEAQGKETGIVIETLQTGYTLNGRLLRAAAVTVAK